MTGCSQCSTTGTTGSALTPGSCGAPASGGTATQVLIAGGYGPGVVSNTDLFDGGTAFAASGNMVVGRANHASALLHNGNILVTGGIDSSNNPLDTAEIFDAASKTFGARPLTMQSYRKNHTATLLMHPDHRVLLLGGIDNSGNATNSAEALYNGQFVPIGTMTTARAYHTATLLSPGNVLITGGFDSSGAILASAELFSPTGAFTAISNMGQARMAHTATWFKVGQTEAVLIAGGGDSAQHGLNSAVLYDPATTRFAPTVDTSSGQPSLMHDYRMFAAATVLLDGRVLITGGYDASSRNLSHAPATSSAEIYDPSTGQFTYTTHAMHTARVGHTATLLQNGLVLIAGGRDQNNNDPNPFAELYDPSTGCDNFTALPVASGVPATTGHSATALTCINGASFAVPGC